ncbi:MAG TPA: hypothetical protein ENI87_05245 [bacterium]|nr:hypothetical protein [bacterium]
MSMNFGREQALLRQRFTEAGSEQTIAERRSQFGDKLKHLGAAEDEILRAARELTEQFPEMGRAQMTAFVRTLWQSKTYDLQRCAVEVLCLRAELLEPPDLPFLEGLLQESLVAPVTAVLADRALGTLVCRSKKLWKDLQRLAKGSNAALRRAAVLATRAPVCADPKVFERFEKLVTPLLEVEDPELQAAIDATLAQAREHDADAVRQFAAAHGRELD